MLRKLITASIGMILVVAHLLTAVAAGRLIVTSPTA